MSNLRLSFALDQRGIVLPDSGRIAVFRARAGFDPGIARDRLHVIQGFRPDHDALAEAGFDVSVAPSGEYAAAIVCLPRAKAEARALIAQAVQVTGGGLVVVDGQKTDGVDSILREIRARVDVGDVIAKAHGKVFSFMGGDFADWADPGPRDIGGFVTRAGVFSADGPDRGSVALAQALPAQLPANVADLGAGWGYLARAILARQGVKTLHLVEAEHAALDCARLNIPDARAQFHWADATRFRPPTALDAVITNPPFHTERAADTGLGQAFIAAAAAMLAPGGVLWLVANRHLPYEVAINAHFGEMREVAGDRSFKILQAARPKGKGARRRV